MQIKTDQQLERYGDPTDPALLLLLDAPSDTSIGDLWCKTATELAQAGRYILTLALDPVRADHGGPPASFSAQILAAIERLDKRPAIVSTSVKCWQASLEVALDRPHLASGLIHISDFGTEAEKAAHSALHSISNPASATREKRHLYLPVLLLSKSGGTDAIDWPFAETIRFHNLETDPLNLQFGEEKKLSTETILPAMISFLEKRIPRAPIEYLSGSDQRCLRDAMGCFATGVTIVTTMGDDACPVGLTANSFTSVSLDPPLILVCIANNTGSVDCFRECEGFAINVLHIGQQQGSNLFARRGVDKFGQVEWESGLYEAPILKNSLASYECSQHQIYDGGDHIILVGEVQRARFEPNRDPLLYFKGRYRRLHFGA